MKFILLHKAYIIFGLKFRKTSLNSSILIVLLSVQALIAQQSYNDYGFLQNFNNNNFRMNSVESNIANYSTTKDWEFSIALNSILNSKTNINLKSFSIGKRIIDHYLYMKYSPGIKQDFIFNSRTEVLIGDSIQKYKSNLTYSEKYAIGYSYNFSNKFSAGFSLRYFQQKFAEEYPAYFSNDTTNIIQIKNEVTNKKYWCGDIGIEYLPYENLSFSLSSTNLAILKDFDAEDEESEFEIKTTKYNIKQNKGILFGFKYYPNDNIALLGEVESNKSFIFGTNYNLNLSNSSLTFGATILHDKHQLPFIAGVIPSINYSNYLFSISLSYLKYFDNRSEAKSLEQFKNYGIKSIQNNFFSQDRINLMLNFALSFKENKQIKFVDLETDSEIFPNFAENYIDIPIAIGKVVNLTDKIVSIKPSCYIENITSEPIYSPIITAQPLDTVEVPFFILVDESKSVKEKTKISQANFYLTSINKEPDDEIQRPILIHNINSWDGKVSNLRYFVKSDLDYSNKYSFKILNRNKGIENNPLKSFEKIKLLFTGFARNMNYVSDRRASVDFVQFPNETLELRGGDCDDLSVCFSSILESIGIQTAFIDYKPINGIGHVTLLLNTNLSPNESELITINQRKYFVRKNYSEKEELWIPIEITSLNNFDEAWNLGANKFYSEAIDNFGLSKGTVEIIDIY